MGSWAFEGNDSERCPDPFEMQISMEGVQKSDERARATKEQKARTEIKRPTREQPKRKCNADKSDSSKFSCQGTVGKMHEIETREHSNEKPFSCIYCHKGFAHEDKWKRHELSHVSWAFEGNDSERCPNPFEMQVSMEGEQKSNERAGATKKPKARTEIKQPTREQPKRK